MSPANYWKVGLFVMSGFAVVLVALVALGGREDARVERVDLFFDEPVDGLSVGSEVRLRGIPVGAVKEIKLAPDQKLVHVTTQIYVATLERLGARGPDDDPAKSEERTREKRMRGQLSRNPLTGLATINVDVYSETDDVAFPQQWSSFTFNRPNFVVLTAPSTFKGLLADAAKMLQEVPGLIDDAKTLLKDVDKAVVALEVDELSADAQQLLQSLNKEVEALDLAALQAQVADTLEEAKTALRDIRTSVDRLLAPDGSVEKLLATYDALGKDVDAEIKSARLGDLSDSARRTLDAATGTADSATALVGDLRADAPRLRRLVDKIQQLVDLLERNPGALLRGKKPSRIPEGGKR